MDIQKALEICAEGLVKPFEGYHKRLPDGSCMAYPDPGTKGDPWTIGWGTTGPHVTKNTVWTRERADQECIKDLFKFASGVLNLSPNLVNEPERRLAALTSFAYNCGLGNYRISTLRKRVNESKWEEAVRELKKWNKAAGKVLPGLTRRRLAEGVLLI